MPNASDTADELASRRHQVELKRLAHEAGLAAVREALSRASTTTLAAVVTGANDPHYVLMVLARDVPPAPAERLIAEAEAQMRTASFRARMSEQAGGMLDRREVAALLGVTPAAVSAMHRRREIIGVEFGRESRFPAAQFKDGKPVAGLQQLLAALGDMRPWVMLQSLLVPLSGFAPEPASMLELLRSGAADDVVIKLRALARSWAS